MSRADDLRELASRWEADDQASDRQAKTDERFDRIEGSLAKLTDSLVQREPPKPPPADDDDSPRGSKGGGGGTPPPPPDDDDDDDLPMERVTRANVPRIYSGDDEPATVRYIDADTGETKSRKGRQKGKVATVEVETVDEKPPDDDDGPAS